MYHGFMVDHCCVLSQNNAYLTNLNKDNILFWIVATEPHFILKEIFYWQIIDINIFLSLLLNFKNT